MMHTKRLGFIITLFSFLLILSTFPLAKSDAKVLFFPQQEEEGTKVTLIDFQVEIQLGKDWVPFDEITSEGVVPELPRGAPLRFQATILNQNSSEIELQSFSANIYSPAILIQVITKTFKVNTPVSVILNQNTSRTEILEGKFDQEINNGTFKLQVLFNYRLLGQSYEVESKNLSFSIPTMDIDPPEVILWIWLGITFCLLCVMVIGVYGKIQLRRLDKKGISN